MVALSVTGAESFSRSLWLRHDALPARFHHLPIQEPIWLTLAKDWLLTVEESVNPFYFAGRMLVFVVLALWAWKFITTPLDSNYTGKSFLHLVNLPFHKAGHLLFMPFGRFMTILGGSLRADPHAVRLSGHICVEDSRSIRRLGCAFVDGRKLHGPRALYQRCSRDGTDTARGVHRTGGRCA